GGRSRGAFRLLRSGAAIRPRPGREPAMGCPCTGPRRPRSRAPAALGLRRAAFRDAFCPPSRRRPERNDGMTMAFARPWRAPLWPGPEAIALALFAAASGLALRGLAIRLPPALWWQAFSAPDVADPRQLLVAYSYLPRILTAWLCGAALALAGVL